jgi:hypothetical protein
MINHETSQYPSRCFRRSGDTTTLPFAQRYPAWSVRGNLFRLTGNFRVTRFFMRNGLKVNGLEMKTSKNSPPASASAHVFPEELFFEGGGKDAAITGRQDARHNLLRPCQPTVPPFLASQRKGFLRSASAEASAVAREAMADKTAARKVEEAGGNGAGEPSKCRLMPHKVAWCRIVSLRATKVFLRKADPPSPRLRRTGAVRSVWLGLREGFFRRRINVKRGA